MQLHEESYPFDNMRISVEGVIKTLDTRFANFVKYERFSDQSVSGRRTYHCKYHSFWHDNLDDPVDRAKYERRAERFLKLHQAATHLLFVFVCNSSTEVGKGEQLIRSLFQLFPWQKVWLLMIAGCQAEEKFWEVEKWAGHLMVHGSVTRENGPGYRQGINAAIRRVVTGKPSPNVVADCAAMVLCCVPYLAKDPRWSPYTITRTDDDAADDVEGEGEQGTVWRVVGGGDSRGIIVRSGPEFGSPELPRLARGARIEEQELRGERLHYRKLEGAGPDWGWVSVSSRGMMLLQPESSPSPAYASYKLLKRRVARMMRAWLEAARADPE